MNAEWQYGQKGLGQNKAETGSSSKSVYLGNFQTLWQPNGRVYDWSIALKDRKLMEQ